MSCYPVTNTVSHHRIEFYTNSIGFCNNIIKKTTVNRITFFVKCVLGLIPIEFNVVLLVLIGQKTSHRPNTRTNGDQRPLVSIKTNTVVLITITSKTISVMFFVLVVFSRVLHALRLSFRISHTFAWTFLFLHLSFCSQMHLADCRLICRCTQLDRHQQNCKRFSNCSIHTRYYMCQNIEAIAPCHYMNILLK